MSYPKYLYTILLVALTWSACLKHSDSPMKISTTKPFKTGDLVSALNADSSAGLFRRAFNRLNLGAQLDSARNYTIFAPYDSAMTAAGLTAAAIDALPIDSLRKLITYQIVSGTFDEIALTNTVTSQQLQTLRQDTVIGRLSPSIISSHILYVKKQNALYFNGVTTPWHGPATEASNGYLYDVGRVFTPLPSTGTLYDVIHSQPDLTLFDAALQLADSLMDVGFEQTFFGGPYYDPNELLTYFLSHPLPKTMPGMAPTILAPTNKAFNDAGFYTVDDIRQYTIQAYTGIDQSTYLLYYFPTIDSVVARHILINTNSALHNKTFTTWLFYNDLMSPEINNGVFNTYIGPTGSDMAAPYLILRFPTNLQFFERNGMAYVQWNNDPGSAVPIPRDADPAVPVNNFNAINGSLFKIDKLFYPLKF
jgi:uncharacterized surface protein with fasciclin (FAS1) repeats